MSMNRTYTYSLHTLGCKVNTYESDLISEKLKAAGFSEVEFTDPADVVIINTCTVTNIADRKTRQMLHRAKKLNPDAVIVAAGCYADSVSQKKGLPDDTVDLWVGNREKNILPELLLKKLSGRNDPVPEKEVWEKRFLTELDGHTRAFVKVEDGCGMFCSYCIIPYVRGKVTARPVEDTLLEVEGLSEKGVTEVVLTGIHLSSMGKELLRTIEGINKIPGILRIRLGSLEPRLITEGFTAELKKYEKLCHHFHLSLQSGSDDILKAMKRRYTAREYAEGCRILREAFPDVAITTDIIVGFPGETEENFRESVRFAEEIGFYEAHIFKYSRRKGTVADTLPDQIPESVKSERSEELIRITEGLSHRFREKFTGRDVEFLAEEIVEVGDAPFVTGYTGEYVRCMLPIGEDFVLHPGEILTGRALSVECDRKEGEYLLLEK